MKWSLVGLLALGFLAAVCAVVLVLSLRGEKPEPRTNGAAEPAPEPTRVVLVATREMSPRQVLSANDVEGRPVPESVAPEDAFADPVQIVGRVLVTTVAAGQAFSPEHFASRDSGMHLASALMLGYRAVTVTLDDDGVTEQVLYPGCYVDVVANVRSGSGADREAVSLNLLEGIMVLKVGSRTVVAPDEQRKETTDPTRRSSVVTVLVQSQDATRLNLAVAEGSIAFVLRNPLDDSTGESQPSRFSSLVGVFRDDHDRASEHAELERVRKELNDALAALEASQRQHESVPLQAPVPAIEPAAALWETTILRGGKAETKTFVLTSASE